MRKSADPNSRFQRRRRAKIARWGKPIETRWERMRAWTNMLLVDHGVFRLVYLNMHRVGERAWRSAQPAPHQIRAFARAGGRSVVSLRGGHFFGSLPLERETCEAEGLAFHNFVLRSRSLPSREELRAAEALFDRLEYPVLFHCKSGADRAGFMAALYLMLAEGRPLDEARAELSWRFGHVRQSKTGVLDAFFDAYERDCADPAIGAMPLAHWIERHYDREAVMASHRETRIGWLVGDVALNRE